MTNDEHHHNEGKFFFGLFLGGLIGALTIFFVGTPEGKKAGKAIGKKGKELYEDVLDRVGELEEKGKELVARGEDLKDELREKFENKKEELTQDTVNRIDTVLTNIESLQQKGIETTENLRKQFRNIPKKTSS